MSKYEKVKLGTSNQPDELTGEKTGCLWFIVKLVGFGIMVWVGFMAYAVSILSGV